MALSSDLSNASKRGLAHAGRIPLYVAAAMLATALVLDLVGFFLGLIPIIGILLLTKMVTLIAIPLFGVWFALSGVTLLSGERVGLKIISVIGSIVIEIVPILDLLPGIFAGVLGILIANWLETRGAKSPSSGIRPRIHFSGPQKVATSEART